MEYHKYESMRHCELQAASDAAAAKHLLDTPVARQWSSICQRSMVCSEPPPQRSSAPKFDGQSDMPWFDKHSAEHRSNIVHERECAMRHIQQSIAGAISDPPFVVHEPWRHSQLKHQECCSQNSESRHHVPTPVNESKASTRQAVHAHQL